MILHTILHTSFLVVVTVLLTKWYKLPVRANRISLKAAPAATTSRETELKLTNVAKASLQELLIDYEDYLRVRELEQWPTDSEKSQQTRRYCATHNDAASYRDAIKTRSDETVANIAITLIHQADFLLMNLIEHQKREFLSNGGIREEMTRARINERNKQ
jgi:four helix bundle suffix protein